MRRRFARHVLRTACVTLAFLSAISRPGPHAHEGEEAGPAAQSNAAVPPHPTHVATTPDLEVVARHEPFEPGRAEDLLVYVSDWATNAPITGARLAVTLRSPDGLAWQGAAVAGTGPGSYRARPLIRRAGTYNLIVQITGARRASVAMPGVLVGEPAAGTSAGASHRVRWILLALLALVAGVLVGLRLGRGRPPGRRTGGPKRAASAALLALSLATAALGRVASAHEGHDAGPVSGTSVLLPGGTVWLAKEAQFAANVRTIVATAEARPQQVMLLGRVAPSPRGKADVLAPQAGRLDPIHGRFPTLGQVVRKGETVATILVVDALRVHAPITGIISDVSAVPGQSVQAGQKLFEIVDPREVWVHADVFPSDLAATGGATRALITVPGLPASPILPGQRVTSGTTAGETPGTSELWFAVPNRGGLLKPGAIANVAVETAVAQTGVAVPRSALLDRNGQTVAFVHTAPEHFQMRAVTIQPGAGETVLVTSGITVGERVVVTGGYQLLTGGTPLAGP